MQARVEQTIPHSNKLHPKLNLESEAAKIRNNTNQFENVNLLQNKLVEPIQSKEEPIMDSQTTFAYKNTCTY